MRFEINPNVPCFAVIGRVNSGKSSVLATLLEQDDNSIIPISNTPGETTKNQLFTLDINNETLIQFIDTPGFQQALGVKKAILALHQTANPNDTGSMPSLATLKAFVEQNRQQFPDECELLLPC